jgi:signal transduction histidine kinase
MRISSRMIDIAVAAVLLLWSLPNVPWWWRPPGHGATTPVVFGYLLMALLQSVPFVWWRRVPVIVLCLSASSYVMRGLLAENRAAAGAAVLVAAYGVGAFGVHRRVAQIVGALSLTVAAGIGTFDNDHRIAGVPWALLGAAFIVGDAATARRQEAAAATEAAHLAERARIAREFHDVLAHQLSAITMQAGAARLAVPDDPAKVLGTIEQLGREALTEVSHLLGVLRREVDATPSPRPAPSLTELDALIAGCQAAGAQIAFTREGAPIRLAPGLELSAYRIVQEALTNAGRHAPDAAIQVSVGYRTDHLELIVSNGPPPRLTLVASGGGLGLLGIRERVAANGGQLDTRATAEGGFVVSARLPYATALAR